MTLRVLPEGLAATSAAVEAVTAQLAAAHAVAAPVVSAVVPPAADPVSLGAAAVFSGRAASIRPRRPRASRCWAGPGWV